MVPIGTAIYKEFTGKNIINLIFATLLLIESFISCYVTGDFDYDIDHQLILFKETMCTIDNPLDLQLLLSKIDILASKKTPREELAKNPPCISTTLNKRDIKVYFLISAIDTTMTLAIPKQGCPQNQY